MLNAKNCLWTTNILRPPARRARVFAAWVLCVSSAVALPAQTFNTLFSFDSLNGAFPYGAMLQAPNGVLYGTTEGGGTQDFGAIFKITPNGKLSVIYSFCPQGYPCVDGAYPEGALIQDAQGNFYGTTVDGGAGCYGCGSIFKITPGGTLTTLYSFTCPQPGECPDGANPESALVRGSDGSFYGTTLDGGGNDYGTVFKITPTGTLTTLHNFCTTDCADGFSPYSGLIQAYGEFYGTTVGGGLGGIFGPGTVYKITASGALTTLYEFQGTFDGWHPNGLVLASDGNFYGTTQYGGPNDWGTVFRMTPSGTLITFYSFCSQAGCADGGSPSASLIEGTDGSLYGTTQVGGANGTTSSGFLEAGTVFRITRTGTFTVLHSFCAQGAYPLCTDGEQPIAGLIQDTNGKFYGSTGYGGTSRGTIFSLSVGLSQFVEAVPAAGAVGSAIKILGTNLTGATSVAFNGTAATFKVVSPSQIITSVPAGATSGAIEVVTPGGTLASNVAFRVTL